VTRNEVTAWATVALITADDVDVMDGHDLRKANEPARRRCPDPRRLS
jgi:hypothetical protein